MPDVRRQRGEERRDGVACQDGVSQKKHAADGERGENDPPSFGREHEHEHDRDRNEGVLRQQSRAERGGEAGVVVAPEGLERDEGEPGQRPVDERPACGDRQRERNARQAKSTGEGQDAGESEVKTKAKANPWPANT